MRSVPRSAGGWYFVGQGVATALWWAWMAGSPDARGWFFVDLRAASLRPFFLADLVVLAPASVSAGCLALQGSARARMAAWIVCGCVLYATVAELGANWPVGQRPWADVSMAAACVGSLWAARSVERCA